MNFDPYRYRGRDLHVEGVALKTIAARVGTPFYAYSAEKIRSQFRRFDRAFDGRSHTICFAVKVNSSLAVLRLLALEGAGADIVSGGELALARRAGISADRIVFAGVGKTEAEIEAALQASIFMFNVESEEELELIHSVARRLRRTAPVALRVNPDVEVDTHHHIATGRAENKFGVPFPRAEAVYRRASRMPWLKVVGVQSHIGSQILDVKPYRRTLEKLLPLVDRLAKAGIPLQTINLGGGLGVPYRPGQKGPDPSDLAREVLPLLEGRSLRLIFEPGRFMVAEAGCLVTKVLYRKETAHKNFVIVDAAMNDLARPALYDAYHHVQALRRGGRSWIADVVGPICESADYLAKGRRVPMPKAGDLWAVMTAGAYGYSMSSRYNARPRVPEVLVDGKKWWVVRERETLRDLTRGETLPEVLR
jgi:diaminopimelate decarboxylase